MQALWPTTSHRLAPGALCRRLLSTRPTSPSDVTRPPSGFVSDAGRVLSAESRARLEGKLSALDTTGKAQMALVVLERLGDETASVQDHSQFTAALYDLWGVGQAAAQNGVLLAVFTESRRIEARTGVGARRALSDTWLASMLQQEMAPRLREGDVSGGVEAATECILDRLAQGGEEGEDGSGAAGAPPVTLGALALAAAGLATWEFQVDRRRRRCTSCPADEAVTMERVPSELDGASEPTPLQAASQGLLAPDSRLAALSPCERDERRLGAVVFGLLRCPRCHTERVLAVETGRYQTCASCHCRCERSETTTLAGATATGEGRERVDTYCEHCGRREAREVAVAREERSAFGSSAGGGGASATFLLQADGWRDTPPSEHLERAVRRGRAAVQSWAR